MILNSGPPVGNAPIEEATDQTRLLVYIKTGSSRMRKEFSQIIRQLGLELEKDENGKTKVVQSWNFNAAFEIAGSPQALEILTQQNCVLRWEYVVTKKAPNCIAGQGQTKKAGSHSADRHS